MRAPPLLTLLAVERGWRHGLLADLARLDAVCQLLAPATERAPHNHPWLWPAEFPQSVASQPRSFGE